GGRDRLTYIYLRWPHLATEARGHYSELRQCLNDYADRLAEQIDAGPGPPGFRDVPCARGHEDRVERGMLRGSMLPVPGQAGDPVAIPGCLEDACRPLLAHRSVGELSLR